MGGLSQTLRGLLVALGALAAPPGRADSIEMLDAWLSDNRPEYYAGLNPGVDDETLDGFEAEFGVVLPDTFRRLYRWRNGHGDYLAPAFIDNQVFLPLEAITSVKRDLDPMIGHDFPEHDWWERDWIPITEGYGGDRYVVVANGTSLGGPMLWFWHDDAERPVLASSLDDWLSSIVVSMQDGTHEADGVTYPARPLDR